MLIFHTLMSVFPIPVTTMQSVLITYTCECKEGFTGDGT